MATYTVELTGRQLIDFSTLARRLVRADEVHPMRADLANALIDFDRLLPDVSDEDSEAWLAKVEAGKIVNWAADPEPLTA